MESKYVLVIIAMFGTLALAEQLNGPCPRNHRIVEKIDWMRMNGRWFIVKQHGQNPDEAGLTCPQVYLNHANPYLNFTIIRKLSNGSYDTYKGNGLVRDTGRLSMFVQKKNEFWTDVLYEVMSTDFYNYALIYLCRNIAPFSSYQETYVFSRTSELDKSLYPKMNPVLKDNGLKPTTVFQDTVQNCGAIQCNGENGDC